MKSCTFYLEGEGAADSPTELKERLRELCAVRQTVLFENGFTQIHEILHNTEGSIVHVYNVKTESATSVKVAVFVSGHVWPQKALKKILLFFEDFALRKGLVVTDVQIRQVFQSN